MACSVKNKDPEAVAIPHEQLHPITARVEEEEDVARERILAELVAHDRVQPVEALAEVDAVARSEDAHARGQAQHRSRALTKRASWLSSISTGTTTRRPPTSTISTRLSATEGSLGRATSSTKPVGDGAVWGRESTSWRSFQAQNASVPAGTPLSRARALNVKPRRSRRPINCSISSRRFMHAIVTSAAPPSRRAWRDRFVSAGGRYEARSRADLRRCGCGVTVTEFRYRQQLCFRRDLTMDNSSPGAALLLVWVPTFSGEDQLNDTQNKEHGTRTASMLQWPTKQATRQARHA